MVLTRDMVYCKQTFGSQRTSQIQRKNANDAISDSMTVTDEIF